jgi:class 3 adenylate cyclase
MVIDFACRAKMIQTQIVPSQPSRILLLTAGNSMGDKADLERKLAAVLASDVVGYSRLMQVDEARTLKALEAVNGIAKAQIELHRGRISDAHFGKSGSRSQTRT